MATLTIRLPDDKHNRLKALARRKKMSVNKLIEEMSTQTLAEFDSETRFRALAASGNVGRGLELLDKLDAAAQGKWRLSSMATYHGVVKAAELAWTVADISLTTPPVALLNATRTFAETTWSVGHLHRNAMLAWTPGRAGAPDTTEYEISPGSDQPEMKQLVDLK